MKIWFVLQRLQDDGISQNLTAIIIIGIIFTAQHRLIDCRAGRPIKKGDRRGVNHVPNALSISKFNQVTRAMNIDLFKQRPMAAAFVAISKISGSVEQDIDTRQMRRKSSDILHVAHHQLQVGMVDVRKLLIGFCLGTHQGANDSAFLQEQAHKIVAKQTRCTGHECYFALHSVILSL